MLEKIKTALDATPYPFAHFGWSHSPNGTYGVYAETGGVDLEADNRHAEQGLSGRISLFTRDSSATPRETIEAALEQVEDCAWYFAGARFDEATGMIELEWAFEVI